jgi:hypothetical protein
MNETCYDLLESITSTVRLKGNKSELEKLDEVKQTIEKIKNLFYNSKDKFFVSSFRDSQMIEVLDRTYFNKVKSIIETCYVNTEILMTRNKLLFSDASDEFLTDLEIKDQIKRDYIDG